MKIILTGPAGSGKDFMRDFLSKVEVVDVKFTTRPKREGEIDGYSYNYISEEELRRMRDNDLLFSKLIYNGWWYSISKESWLNSRVFIMTPRELAMVPEEELRDVVIVFFDIPYEIRKQRLEVRGGKDSVERRLKADYQDFYGFSRFHIKVTKPLFDRKQLYSTILSYAKCQDIK